MHAPVGIATALVAVAVLLVVLSLATAVQRASGARRDRRRLELETEAKRQLLTVLADGAHVLPTAQSRIIERVAAPLLTKLRGEDRAELVALLERSGVLDRARAQLTGLGAVRRARAAELLGAASDARALPDLVRLLDDRRQDVRIVAARALGKLGAPGVEPLLTALDDRRPIPAGIVTMALVHVGPDAAPALAEALASSPSPRARTVAAELLGRLDAFAAAQRLVAAVADDPDAGVRAASAHALGRLGLPGACRTLLEHLEPGTDLQLRLACIRALGEIGGDDAIAALPPLLSDADHRIARTAASALAATGTAGRSALEDAAADRTSAPAAREQLAWLALRDAARTSRHRTGQAA